MLSEIKFSRLSVILIVLIIFILGYFFIFVPIARQWKELNRRIEVVNLQYLRNSRTVTNFDDYVKHYKEFELITKQTKTAEEEIAFFLKEIESFINNLNVTINDIKPLPDEQDNQAHVFFIELEIESSVIDFISFLHKIASSPTMIRVEKMTLMTKGKKDNRLSLRLIISKTFIV